MYAYETTKKWQRNLRKSVFWKLIELMNWLKKWNFHKYKNSWPVHNFALDPPLKFIEVKSSSPHLQTKQYEYVSRHPSTTWQNTLALYTFIFHMYILHNAHAHAHSSGLLILHYHYACMPNSWFSSQMETDVLIISGEHFDIWVYKLFIMKSAYILTALVRIFVR